MSVKQMGELAELEIKQRIQNLREPLTFDFIEKIHKILKTKRENYLNYFNLPDNPMCRDRYFDEFQRQIDKLKKELTI